jgi:hypothetical protein
MFCFEQEMSEETFHHIVDSCQHLKKLNVDQVMLGDEDIIHVIKKLGKQLTSLSYTAAGVRDVGHLYLKNCAR